MQKFILGLSIILTLTFMSPIFMISQSHARVILKEKTKFYTIKGTTGVEIYKSMLKNGPDHGGSLKDVLASTSFKFDFKNDVFTVYKNRCVLTNLDIIVNVTYTYPKWRDSKKASAETRRAWKKFQKIAILHEKEHVKITRKFANDYEKLLRKSRRRAASECEDVSLSEKIRTSFAIRKHERLHRLFDRRDLRRGGRGYNALLELVKAK